MRLALTIHSLEGLGGTESYVATLGDHLQRDGHEVWIHAQGRGAGSQLVESLGLRLVSDAHDLPRDLDAAIPQDGPAALDIFAVMPELPQIFVAHTDLFDVGLPPQVAGALRAVVTLYERAHQRILAQAVQVPVERLRQPVDIERFKPTTVLAERPRRAVAFGNYMVGERLRMLERACELAGVQLDAGGASGGDLELRPEDLLNRYDIVFGKAKIVHEAMGCGRAVYILDHNGAEGWVTAGNYAALVADNFGGRSAPRLVTAESLAADLREYDPAMGIVNRDLIVANHDAIGHTAGLVEIIRRHVGEAPVRPDNGNAAELARLVRLNWRHQSDVFQTRRLLELQSAELDDARRHHESLQAELARAEAELAIRRGRSLRYRLRRLLGR